MSRRLLLSALLAASLLVAFEAGRASASRSATSSIPAPATHVRAPDVRGIGEPDPSLPFPTPHPVIPRVPSARAASVPGQIRGVASWYATGPSGLYAAAGPALRAMLGPGWRGRWVTVRAGGRAIRVRIIDACQCYGVRVLDLSDEAFAALAPLSRGLVAVTVR